MLPVGKVEVAIGASSSEEQVAEGGNERKELDDIVSGDSSYYSIPARRADRIAGNMQGEKRHTRREQGDRTRGRRTGQYQERSIRRGWQEQRSMSVRSFAFLLADTMEEKDERGES